MGCGRTGEAVPKQTIERLALDTVENIETSNDVSEIATLFADLIAAAGFAYSVCMKVPEGGEEPTTGLLLNSLPGNWWQHYLEQGYVVHDPVIRETLENFRPFTWRDVTADRLISLEARAMFDDCASLGMRDGFVVPIYETSGYTGLVSISGERCDIDQPTRNALSLASVYLHNKLCALRRRSEGLMIDLTDREGECLTWAAAGKSDWEIGQILNISAKTVNYHIENAKRKLGVSTRVQAIVAAIRYGRLRH